MVAGDQTIVAGDGQTKLRKRTMASRTMKLSAVGKRTHINYLHSSLLLQACWGLIMMTTDSSARFISSKHTRPRHDLFLGFEGDEAEDARAELACPFCSEGFDIIGLCCHIDDDHPLEAKNGVCPICAAWVGMDLVWHITAEHGSFLKRKRRAHRSSIGSHYALSIWRKGLHEGNFESLLEGSSSTSASSNAASDPLISSFICTMPVIESAIDIEANPLDEMCAANKSSDEAVESVEHGPCGEDNKGSAQRTEFIRTLLLSTVFDDL